ncbi:MAG TPA: 2-isopropylmalate synthase, partial [Ktedonobacteraceae bacterium]|nr:2-isopropylmalate synthase [Ktedonobacteraceae bacterium]
MQARSQTRMPGGMQKGIISRYRPLPPIDLPDRQWPARVLTTAPIWCSVDLRDGNQALPIPMSVEEKLEMFKLLVAIGFKEIEVSFPSSSQIEFDFTRRLIEEGHIPDDVTIQILTQAREDLIRRSAEAIRGAKKAIFHLYNSTSPQQRRIVFGMEKPEIIEIAARGARLIKDLVQEMPETKVTFEYTPESFSLTEVDFALEICETVVDVWQPTRENKIILNLPDTVQVAMPNVHADQIEWMCRHLRNREAVIISVHTHNDRGTGVAAAEQGLLAGAERVEGTLFGNGERTGNVDIVTLALNMYMQGIDPGLDFSNIAAVREVYEKCTRMSVPERQPYAGELVFTAFSGSHQDAIRKGMAVQDTSAGAVWEVPYLPIDPSDIGRTYEAIIRINSQSGKGGVAYVLESEFGLHLPKGMHGEFGKVIKSLADASGNELSSAEIFQAFTQEYLEREGPFTLEKLYTERKHDERGVEAVECRALLGIDGVLREVHAQGLDHVDAFVNALNQGDIAGFKILSSAKHLLNQDSDAQVVAFMQIKMAAGKMCFGAAVETSAEVAEIKAVVSALNRAMG